MTENVPELKLKVGGIYENRKGETRTIKKRYFNWHPKAWGYGWDYEDDENFMYAQNGRNLNNEIDSGYDLIEEVNTVEVSTGLPNENTPRNRCDFINIGICPECGNKLSTHQADEGTGCWGKCDFCEFDPNGKFDPNYADAPKPDKVLHPLQLRVGGIYKNRKGERSYIIIKRGIKEGFLWGIMPYEDTDGNHFRENGRNRLFEESPLDLIEEMCVTLACNISLSPSISEDTITENKSELKIGIGGVYENGKGDTICLISHIDINGIKIYGDEMGATYSDNGECRENPSSEYDLVKELAPSPPQYSIQPRHSEDLDAPLPVKLKVGGVYKNRKGETRTINTHCPGLGTWCYQDSELNLYQENGRFSLTPDSEYDLIEEVVCENDASQKINTEIVTPLPITRCPDFDEEGNSYDENRKNINYETKLKIDLTEEINTVLRHEKIDGDAVNHPSHYAGDVECQHCGKPIECLDIVRHMPFNLGNVVKYVWRCDKKGKTLEDLKKAAFYLNDEIKKLENNQ